MIEYPENSRANTFANWLYISVQKQVTDFVQTNNNVLSLESYYSIKFFSLICISIIMSMQIVYNILL